MLNYPIKMLSVAVSNLVIRNIWKVACITSIISPDKSATNGELQHPISLHSPLAKVIDVRILRDLSKLFDIVDHAHSSRDIMGATIYNDDTTGIRTSLILETGDLCGYLKDESYRQFCLI